MRAWAEGAGENVITDNSRVSLLFTIPRDTLALALALTHANTYSGTTTEGWQTCNWVASPLVRHGMFSAVTTMGHSLCSLDPYCSSGLA